MRWLRRFRERLVLGQVEGTLAGDERVLSWAHARIPGIRAPAVVLVTDQRCLLHIASSQIDDHASAWLSLERWELRQPTSSKAKLILETAEGVAISELALNSRARAERASKLLAAIAQCTDLPCDRTIGPAPRRRRLRRVRPPELEAAPRGPREYARRTLITVVGVLGLLLAAAFSTPIVPGPGALTAVASIALLGREYEWARDIHVWAHRQLERFVAWLKRKKASFRRQPVELERQGDDRVRDAA